jgi:hypothetical protein
MSEEAIAEPGRNRWRLPFTWLGLLALAWFVYELTQNPALGAVIVCLKFGWEDFRAARWLWANDHSPWRRRATFWLYLAWGLWKTAIVAFLMSVGFACVPHKGVAQPPPNTLLAFFGTFLTTLVSFALSMLMTALAVVCAWLGGVRLWLDSAVHRARRVDCWPPTPLCEGRPNRLGHLLLTGLGVLAFLIIIVVLIGAAGGQFGFLFCFALSISAPVLVLVIRDRISCRVWAETPQECWDKPWWDEETQADQEDQPSP